jgi:hypothetical protein
MVVMKKLAKIVLVVSLFLLGISFFQKEKSPPKENILESLSQEPAQSETTAASFKATVDEIVYTIEPLYEYELRGMVVSYFDANSWLDYFHKDWGDFLNIKDLCVIWGENARSGVYEKMKFKTQSWACFYQWPDRVTGSRFRGNQLSNNHLLSDDSEINQKIMKVKKGDQVYIKGFLASYSHSNGEFKRGTSTTREDQGNGACETIYVTDFQVLKKANQGWWLVYKTSQYLIVACLLFLVISFFTTPPRL